MGNCEPEEGDESGEEKFAGLGEFVPILLGVVGQVFVIKIRIAMHGQAIRLIIIL